MKRIAVLGLGYIGLPTSIVAAQAGYDVLGFDPSADKVSSINAGSPTIFEPELTERLWRVLKAGSFKAYTDLQYADCFIITVPAVFKENRKTDLSMIYASCELVAKRLMPGNIVILESTVPVGTTEKIAQFLEENSGLKLGIDFFVAYCPERILPGAIFKEVSESDRIVGGICQHSCMLAQQFYSRFVKGVIHITDDKTAEMVKLIENAQRDVQIAFANQVAEMCMKANLDPYQAIELTNKHTRANVLNPTCGVGGHAIAVDPYFLIESFPEDSMLLQIARRVNDKKPFLVVERVMHKVRELNNQGIQRPRIFAMGLTFKADVDDIHESPALFIAQALNAQIDHLELKTFDPYINQEIVTKRSLSTVTDIRQGINWADIVLILVKHRDFTLLPEEAFGDKIIMDTCGLLHSVNLKQSQALFEGASRLEVMFGKKYSAGA
jgi:UDP-N-acetyl-D-mannosaminuronic acid dehydrogenase